MTQIKLRRDTSANFTSKNPVLGIGEPAYETDTKKLKIGDGTTAYTQLEYFSAGGGGSTNISATLPLKIVDGVISLEVDGQTIQIVDGKLHANLDGLSNEVNTLAGDVAGVQADLLKKEDKLTASTPIIKTEEENPNAVGFTTSGTTMTTSGKYSDGDWDSQSYGISVLNDYMAGTRDNYVDIPYQIGDIVKVPQSSGYYNVSTGAFGFINSSGVFRPVAPLYDSSNRSQSRYDEITIEPYKMGHYLSNTNSISWGGTSSNITTKTRDNYNYCQIRDEGTSVVLITASFGSNTTLTKRVFLKTENDGVQYDKLLKSTMVRVYPNGNQREVLDRSFDTSQFGLYKGLGKLEDLAPNFEAIEAATNQFDVLGTTKVNDLSLALGDGLSVVDGKLAASANMVTTNTAQTITGLKTFGGTDLSKILLEGSKSLIGFRQNSDSLPTTLIGGFFESDGKKSITIGSTDHETLSLNAKSVQDGSGNKFLTSGNVSAYITETYVNGTSGYRLYSDKYIEQWGYKSGTTDETITFLKAFKDTNYNVTMATDDPRIYFQGYYRHKTTTSMRIEYTGGSGGSATGTSWMVTGYIA